METNINKNLNGIGNKIPFSVPENYFENFALEMDSRTVGASVSFKKLLAPWMYMAAMFTGLFLIANVFYNLNQRQKAQETEMYEMYVSSQMDESILFDYYYNETTGNEEKQLN